MIETYFLLTLYIGINIGLATAIYEIEKTIVDEDEMKKLSPLQWFNVLAFGFIFVILDNVS